MTGPERLAANAPAAFRASYDALIGFSTGLDDPSSWAPTGCEGWCVRDLLHHWLGDARRALVALHTPAKQPPDRDVVSYWTDWTVDRGGAANGRRFTRVVASMFLEHRQLVEVVTETAQAVVHASTVIPLDQCVVTQGHVLRVDHLLGTLAVEASVHHLDLTVALPESEPASAEGLSYTRAVVDALLGREAPAQWPDERYVCIATGRAPLSDEEKATMGPDIDRLPLFR